MISGYHRPSTLEQALDLLASTDAAILAGGTALVASGAAVEVIDLQDIGLDAIAPDGDRVTVGAMVRLRDIVDSDLVPTLLRDLAHREAPSTIRNAATIGGTVAALDPESELIAGLLVHDARLTVATQGETTEIPLGDYLEGPVGGIITKVSVATGGVGSAERTGRTPADRPIVSAVARRDQTGAIHLALTGVGTAPRLVDPLGLDALDPPADFRGTAEYRKHLAQTLSARAIDRLTK